MPITRKASPDTCGVPAVAKPDSTTSAGTSVQKAYSSHMWPK